MRRVPAVKLFLLGLTSVALLAQPEPAHSRKALVIGNAHYTLLNPIPVAQRGADAMATALRDAKFEVTEATDLTLTALRSTIENKFIPGLKPGDTCLVYYSGYGIQRLGVNYFVPVDFDPSTKRDVEEVGEVVYEMDRLRSKVKATQVRLQILLVEASWKDAQLETWARYFGLNSPEGFADTVWVFSDARNTSTAVPAEGPGLFTAAFVNAISHKGLNLTDVIQAVQTEVAETSHKNQRPYPVGVGEFYFRAPDPVTPVVITERVPVNVPVDIWPKQGSVANNKDHENYVYIPNGSYQMGCVPSAAAECQENEKPQHVVEIKNSYWLGENDVQVERYRHFVQDVQHRKMPPAPLWDRGWKSGDYPIVNVSWEDAQDYCKWAGGRLPTEAEWEYAARAGSKNQVYPFPDMTQSRENANFLNKAGSDQYDEASPVKKFYPNPFGLFDMAGNVWQWVQDSYDPLYYQHSPTADPPGPPSGKGHVARGGSYASDAAKHLRLSYREHFEGKANRVGFRCLLPDTPEVRAQFKGRLPGQ